MLDASGIAGFALSYRGMRAEPSAAQRRIREAARRIARRGLFFCNNLHFEVVCSSNEMRHGFNVF